MDDPALVRDVKTGRDAFEQRSHRLIGQRLAPDELRKRLSFDEFHRQIRTAQHRLDGEDVVADDRLVLKIVQGRGFAAEQSERCVIFGKLRKQHLDGDDVAGLHRVSFVDLAHAARSDQMIDLVDSVEPCAGGEPAT